MEVADMEVVKVNVAVVFHSVLCFPFCFVSN